MKVPNPFRRSAGPPEDVLARAVLEPGEKVLSAACAGDGTWLLGTGNALVIVRPADAAAVRLPWEQVERADWERESQLFRVSEVGEFGRPRAEFAFELEEPGHFLPLVRERVTASVVLQRRVVVSGTAGLSVIARRAPRGTGGVLWSYEFDPGVEPGDPAVMEAAERGLRSAEDELGL